MARSALLAAAASFGLLFATTSARAQDPAPAPAPPAGKPVTVVLASDSAPTHGVIECSLGDHAGVDDADAATVRDFFAHELANRHAGAGTYEVRLGKLGGRILLVLEEKHPDRTVDERRTLISGVEEVPVAAPRLIDALISSKPLEETQNASNVLTAESRTPTMKQGRMGFAGGIIGATPLTMQSGFAAGGELGIIYEAEHFALTGHGRLASGSSGGQSQFTYFNLGVGARYFVTDGDFAPYLGGGAGFSVYAMSPTSSSYSSGSYDASGNYTYAATPPSYSANGMNLYGEVGIEAFRTHRAAMFAAARLDAPLFMVSSTDGNTTTNKYAMPVSLTVGLIFK